MQSPDLKHVSNLMGILEALRSAARCTMGQMKQKGLRDLNGHQGIYAITDPDDNEVVYIGKTNDGTVEKGVADRVWGHCNKNSDLQTSLVIDPKKMETYYVRTIEILKPSDRGLAELYGIAVYKPRGNRFGRRGVATDLDDPSPIA